MRLAIAIGFLMTAPATLWLTACSSDNNTGDAGDGGADSTTMDDGSGDAGMDSNNMDSSMMDSNNNDGGCSSLDAGACRQCCRMQNMKGDNFLRAAEHTCLCQAQHCLTQCAMSFCAVDGGIDAGVMVCDMCMTRELRPDAGDAGCYNQVVAACAMNADCTAFVACRSACP